MAGSRTIRLYVDDAGIGYSIRCDKSNANAAPVGGSASQTLLPVRTSDVPLLPRGFKPRYVLAYNQANPLQRRRFIIGNLGAIQPLLAVGAKILAEDYPGAGNTAGANATWIVTYYSGERRNLVPAVTSNDTFLTDGTATP